MMKILFVSLLLGIATSFCSANDLSGPFLLWGQEKLRNLQGNSLVQGEEGEFEDIYKDSKAIVIFVRHSLKPRLDSAKLPRFQGLIHSHDWTYLPQRELNFSPFNYNSNIELIYLNHSNDMEDEQIASAFNNAVKKNGEGAVLGILANKLHETSEHFISKRENKESEATTTIQPPASNETDESNVFVADRGRALLFLNNAPMLNISGKGSKLVEHSKTVTFDNHRELGFCRLGIIFIDEGEKVSLRFHFNISLGSWTMKAVEVDRNGKNTLLRLSGHAHSFPSAPLNFSYRCGDVPLIFRNGDDMLTLKDYQVQPWLSGPVRFGDVYDCVGFTTAPIWAGVLVSLFLCGILSIGLMALYDIKTPNKFESSRSKQLTFVVQE